MEAPNLIDIKENDLLKIDRTLLEILLKDKTIGFAIFRILAVQKKLLMKICLKGELFLNPVLVVQKVTTENIMVFTALLRTGKLIEISALWIWYLEAGNNGKKNNKRSYDP